MSEQDREFEIWYESRFGKEGLKTAINHTYLQDGEYVYESTKDKLLVWQAATAEANKRIESITEQNERYADSNESLAREVAELKEMLSDRTQDLEFEYNRAEENFLSCGILQSEIDKLNELHEGINCPVCGSLAVTPKDIWYTKQISELQASNHDLREALEEVKRNSYQQSVGGGDVGIVTCEALEKVDEALSATPAESLQAFDDMKGKP